MAGIYIHIPYCKRKCVYCDFYSTPTMADVDGYVDALVKESGMQKDFFGNNAVATVYVGGGTPSLLNPLQFSRLVKGIRHIHDLSNVQEFTIEVNPDDVTQDLIRAYCDDGVNRVSMGVQSFNDAELAFMGRRHDARQAVDAVEAIRDAGVGNVSIDLIYGVPGQTMESWQRSVDMAISLGVQHISAYNLSYEQGTRLWVMRQNGKVHELDDQLCVDMYSFLVSRLRDAGFEHYEISNFARPGFRSCHNSSYWNFTPYLGLGAAAHGFDGIRRYSNPCSIIEYMHSLNEERIPSEAESLDWWERYDEMVMLRLRVSDGLSIDALRQRFGNVVAYRFESLALKPIAEGLMKYTDGCYSLTERGVMVSDSIIRDLMWDE